jgi:hypothetical protein
LSSHSGINFIVLTKGIPIRIGGRDVDNISSGSWTEYNNVNLGGATSFTARVANPNSAGTIQIRLDSPTGTLIGTCTVSVTGGYQTWTTNSATLTSTTGTHNLYLVYSGGFNIEWFTVGSTTIPAPSYNNSAGGVGVEDSAEGGALTGSENQGQSPTDYQPSVDTYLAALGYSTANGDVQATIVGSGAQGIAWVNNYYNATVPFTHAAFGGYLVSRLDGWTQSDATALVDRSLAATENPITGPVLFDVDAGQSSGLGDKTTMPPITPSTNVTTEEGYDNGNADLLHGADVLEASGITTDEEITSTFFGDEGNLAGYFSFGSNDSSFPNNVLNYETLSFAPGAIGNTYVSSSMISFIGQYVGFNSVNLTGMTSLNVRVSNANGAGGANDLLLVRLDSPSGQIIGSILVNSTGGWQNWATQSCTLTTSVSGVHNVYLEFPPNGYGGNLYNIEWISFQGASSVVEAASYNNLSGGEQLENCSEGGEDMGNITNGGYAVYSQINLASMTSFKARVASAGSGGNIVIHLDSPTGTVVGTCTVPVTGGWQTWTTQTCSLTGASGIHDVYLVFTGGGGYLFNLEWFNFLGGTNVIEVASYNVLSGGSYLESCSEGGQDLGNIPDGQSQMCDLIANGLTGAEGYVNEPTLNGAVGIAYTISHYEAGYNLAESFYAGTPYLGWTATIVGDPLCAPFYGAIPTITPTQASSCSGSGGGVTTESCGEGDLDVTNITNHSYTYYNSVNLAGVKTFRARVASAGSGGNIQIRLTSTSGTLLGTCAVPGTGGEQTWTTEACGLSGTTGTHNVYLVYTGTGSGLFSVEWFGFLPSIEASAYSSESSVQTENCAEGGLDVGYISNGSYTEYNSVNLSGITSFAARVASPSGGSTITIHTGSPTGTVIGTAQVPATGGWQNWTTAYCSVSGTGGTQNVYLVYTTGMNIEWFAFQSVSGVGGGGPQSGSIYNLICKTSGMALDNDNGTTNGATVWQWAPQSGNTNQEWQFNSVGGGYYNLICQTGGLALDNDNGTSNGDTVWQWTLQSGNTNQEWMPVSVGGGYYNLLCLTGGLALDNEGSTSEGTDVWQWTQQSGNSNQEWQLILVP